MENERWADVSGEPGYSVSDCGRVRSNAREILRSNGRVQHIRERILRTSTDEWGYPQVRLNRHTYKVHRLVALAFLPAKQSGQEIRHLDGNPANNRVENLRYGTHSENVLDGYHYRNGNIRRLQKLNMAQVSEIRKRLSRGEKNRVLASVFSVSEQTICDIKHNRLYKHVEVSQ